MVSGRPFMPRTGVVILLSVCVLALAACSSKGSASSSTTTQASTPTGGSGSSGTSGSSPGVSATSVTVGQVDDLSSPIPGLFKGAEDGTKAYFAYINSMGGVNGRKLILDAQDSTFQGGQVATVTGTQIRTDFALVGGSRSSTRPRSHSSTSPMCPTSGSRSARAFRLTPTSTARFPTPRTTTRSISSSTWRRSTRRRSRRWGSSGRTPPPRRRRPRPPSKPP